MSNSSFKLALDHRAVVRDRDGERGAFRRARNRLLTLKGLHILEEKTKCDPPRAAIGSRARPDPSMP